MDDEAARLSILMAQAVPAMLTWAPGAFAMTFPVSVLALSGEPFADLNMLVVGPEPEPERTFAAGAEVAARHGVPLLAVLTPPVAQRLASLAPEFGFTPGGHMPLMLLRADAPVAPQGVCKVKRVDESTVEIAGRLQAAAFGLPEASMTKLLEGSRLAPQPPFVFIASREGVAMSSVTVTVHGDTAGVWSMATPPEHQRKGVGRALLTNVLSGFHAYGIRRFYLMATEAGRPLYESIGFQTVGHCDVWLTGDSVQTHG